MPATTTRQAARERLQRIFKQELDRLIPADYSVPLKGRTFREWEDQGDSFANALVGSMLEERAGLEPDAQVEEGGRCPFCASTHVYLVKEIKPMEVLTPHGAIVLNRQTCRCRACDRTFSPSRAQLASADRGASQSQGSRASGPGIGGAQQL
jgi:hypothetical protein